MTTFQAAACRITPVVEGQTVNVPPGGTVNFIACEPNSGLPYPQCLQG